MSLKKTCNYKTQSREPSTHSYTRPRNKIRIKEIEAKMTTDFLNPRKRSKGVSKSKTTSKSNNKNTKVSIK